MIAPNTQRFMAKRMHARVRSHSGDHAPIVSAAPGLVVDIIREAIGETTTSRSPSFYMRHEHLHQARTNPRSLLGRWANA
jgi:hypothetical protein